MENFPSRVVSRVPLPTLDPGPADPPNREPSPQPMRPTDGNADEMWAYISPFIHKFKACPTSDGITQLIGLPRARDIPWDQSWIDKRGFSDRTPQDIVSLLIQVTGESPPYPCSKCRKGNQGPYEGCIVASEATDPGGGTGILGCGNCIYHGRWTECSLKFWLRKRMAGKPSSGRSPWNPEFTPRHMGRRHRVVGIRPKLGDTRSRLTGSAELGLRQKANAPDRLDGQCDGQSRTLAPAANGSSQSTGHLEMEEWELAPGRVRSLGPTVSTEAPEAAEPPDNVAFSKAYLMNHTVRVSADVLFRVEVITSGSSTRRVADRGRMRVCSVAAGKVRVRVEGEDEFSVGLHGMFKVRAGKACVVQNRLYEDAVLHISEFPDEQ